MVDRTLKSNYYYYYCQYYAEEVGGGGGGLLQIRAPQGAAMLIRFPPIKSWNCVARDAMDALYLIHTVGTKWRISGSCFPVRSGVDF